MEKTFRALKMIDRSFSSYHIETTTECRLYFACQIKLKGIQIY